MGGALGRTDYLGVSGEGDEILLETCDVTGTQSDAFANGGSRSYNALVPWDVPLRLVVTSAFLIAVTFALVMVPELYEYHQIPTGLMLTAVFSGLGLGVLSVLSQIPRRVTRKADALVIEFLLHSHTVPVGDVLELVVLRDGRQFWQLLRRWKVFPSGQKLRLFFGAPSNAGSLLVLLTRRCLWSFVFCLEDPVSFLLDNQRPLSTEVIYRASQKCVLREDEPLSSERIGTVPRGARLKVLEQRGRRVMVKLEGSDTTGWMSYLSGEGVCLLARPTSKGEKGVVGASELSGPSRIGTGADCTDLIELGIKTPGHE